MVVGEDDAGLEQGGGGCLDLGPDILGGGAVGPAIHTRDVGDVTMHQEGIGRILQQDGLQANREATSDRVWRSVDITLAGIRDGGSGTAGGGDLRLPPLEHGRTVN